MPARRGDGRGFPPYARRPPRPRLCAMNTTRLIPSLLCAAALMPAASASADPIRVYKVTAEGTGSFQYDLSLPSGLGMGVTVKRNVAFAWHEQVPSVAFLSNGQGVPLTALGAAQGSISGDASEETTIVGSDGKGGTVTTHGYCEAKDQSLAPGVATVAHDPSAADAGGANLIVAPFGSIGFPAECTAAVYGGHSQLSVDVAPDQFQQRFFLPTEATRQGKIIQLVHASPEQKDKCSPAVSLGDCQFDWSGTLTFEFTGYLGDDGELTPDDLPELPPGGGLQTQTPPPPPGDDDLIVPLPSGGSLSKRGDRASVKVTCGAACSGLVQAYAVRAGA